MITDTADSDITYGYLPARVSPVVKTATGHTCKGCRERWTETRTADSVDTVRWPGWLA